MHPPVPVLVYHISLLALYLPTCCVLQGTAVAHSVHDGLTVAAGAHAYLHGEKVAFGTVTQLVLEGRPQAELDEVCRFCCRVGLPVTLAQVCGRA